MQIEHSNDQKQKSNNVILTLAVAAINAPIGEKLIWYKLVRSANSILMDKSIDGTIELMFLDNEHVSNLKGSVMLDKIPLGEVRNIGIAGATGNWVWLLDSDVYIPIQTLCAIAIYLLDSADSNVMLVKSRDLTSDAFFTCIMLDSKSDQSSFLAQKNRKITSNVAKFSLKKFIYIMKARSIEIIIHKAKLGDACFEINRGIGVDNRVGNENIFLSKLFWTHSFLRLDTGQPILHRGMSSGMKLHPAELWASGHIKKMIYIITQSEVLANLSNLLFYLKKMLRL